MIGFFVENDSMAKAAIPIIRELKACSVDVCLVEGNTAFDRSKTLSRTFPNLDVRNVNKSFEISQDISLFVCFNDWNDEVRLLISSSHKLGIPSVCIQESAIYFGTMSLMVSASYAFVQGDSFLDYVKNKNIVLTGNSRFSDRVRANRNIRKVFGKKVLVNLNFSQGQSVKEIARWLEGVIESAKILENKGWQFVYMTHPRDLTDYRSEFGLKNIMESNANVLPALMSDSMFLISRFSSVIQEAIIERCYVIYFDDDDYGFDFEPDNNIIFEIKDASEIERIVDCEATMTSRLTYPESIRDDYIARHFSAFAEEAEVKIAKSLIAICQSHGSHDLTFRVPFGFKLWVQFKNTVKILLKLRD